MGFITFLCFVLGPDGPRRCNTAAPGAISLRSMAPVKAVYAATGYNFKVEDGGWKSEIRSWRLVFGRRRLEAEDEEWKYLVEWLKATPPRGEIIIEMGDKNQQRTPHG